jgi:hypothetical protein
MLKHAVLQLEPRRWARFLMAESNCFGVKMRLQMTKAAWILRSIVRTVHRSMNELLRLEARVALEGLHRHFVWCVRLNRPGPHRQVAAADRDLRNPLRGWAGAGG